MMSFTNKSFACLQENCSQAMKRKTGHLPGTRIKEREQEGEKDEGREGTKPGGDGRNDIGFSSIHTTIISYAVKCFPQACICHCIFPTAISRITFHSCKRTLSLLRVVEYNSFRCLCFYYSFAYSFHLFICSFFRHQLNLSHSHYNLNNVQNYTHRLEFNFCQRYTS